MQEELWRFGFMTNDLNILHEEKRKMWYFNLSVFGSYFKTALWKVWHVAEGLAGKERERRGRNDTCQRQQ